MLGRRARARNAPCHDLLYERRGEALVEHQGEEAIERLAEGRSVATPVQPKRREHAHWPPARSSRSLVPEAGVRPRACRPMAHDPRPAHLPPVRVRDPPARAALAPAIGSLMPCRLDAVRPTVRQPCRCCARRHMSAAAPPIHASCGRSCVICSSVVCVRPTPLLCACALCPSALRAASLCLFSLSLSLCLVSVALSICLTVSL